MSRLRTDVVTPAEQRQRERALRSLRRRHLAWRLARQAELEAEAGDPVPEEPPAQRAERPSRVRRREAEAVG